MKDFIIILTGSIIVLILWLVLAPMDEEDIGKMGQELISDIEKLEKELGIKKWQ